jgi:hypothetical protein
MKMKLGDQTRSTSKVRRGDFGGDNDSLLGKTSRQGEAFYSASSAIDSLSGGALA